jgi:hypothetical protein
MINLYLCKVLKRGLPSENVEIRTKVDAEM